MPEQHSDAREQRMHTIRGARGASMVLLGSGASLALQFLSLATLSRLLEPRDFGLIAMVSVFVTLGNLLRDFGLPIAGLQMNALSAQQASNLFWMNLGIAGVSAAALAAGTPLLVLLYGEPRLTAVVPALALVVLIGGVTAQIQVNLARRMRFAALVVSDIVAQVMGLATAIALAIMGCGYWALVAQSLVTAFVTLGYRWIASGWTPRRPRKGHGAAAMFRVGADYGGAQLLTFLQSNIDTVVVGVQFGAAQLGYYSRAYQLLTTPASRVLDPLTQVVVTTLNKVKAHRSDPDALLVRIQFGVGTLIVWILATTAGVAPGLLPMVLGDQWSPSVPVFQILAIGGSIWVFNHVSYWAFIMNERSRELLHYNLVSKPLAIMSVLVGAQFGIVGAAWGYAVAMAISWPLNLAWLKRTAGLRARPFISNGVRILVAGGAGGIASWAAFVFSHSLSPVLAIVGGLSAGTAGMAFTTAAFGGSRRMCAVWFRFVGVSLADRRMRVRNASN